jgi:hypothetical protein
MGEVEGISYPCLFAFMADKKATTYRALLKVIHEFVIKKGELHLKQFVCDFESQSCVNLNPFSESTLCKLAVLSIWPGL